MGATQRQALTRALVRHERLLGRAKRPRKKLPRQQYPRLIESAYASAVTQVVGPQIRAAFAPLLAALPTLLARAAAERKLDARLDAGEGREARALIDHAKTQLETRISVEGAASRAATQTAAFNRTQLGRQLQAGIGTDVLGSSVTKPHVVSAFVDSNTALIRGLTDKVTADVSSEVFRAIQDGRSADEVADALRARFEMADRRAALIARDQVGKLYGQVNVMRQKELGVTRFIWNTVGDDRVRDEHAARDGQEYSYDDPPDGELPGEPVMCRCWAEPVLDDLTVESEDDTETQTASAEPEPAPARQPAAPPPPVPRLPVGAREGVGLGRIGVSSEIVGEEVTVASAVEPGVGLGRIGVSSEIAGEPVVGSAAAPAAAAEGPKQLLPASEPAPIGYVSYTYGDETYYQHAVGGGVYLTPVQYAAFETGETVTLTGPNETLPGYEALARKGHEVRYQTEEFIGGRTLTFTREQITSGQAEADIQWARAHAASEAAKKPSLLSKVFGLGRSR